MRLAGAAGVCVARSELVPSSDVAGIRSELIQGAHVLAVDRFDRVGDARVHMEEFAPILGKVGDAKYSGNIETIIKLISRFAIDRQEAVLEAVRRVAVEVLVGNGDAHLKNWAFLYPGGQSPTLSPAYDIVPTILFLHDDELALNFGGSRSFKSVTRKKFARLARVAELPEALILDELDLLALALAFTIPGNVPIDIGHIYGLQDPEGQRIDLEIKSLRPTRDRCARVIARLPKH